MVKMDKEDFIELTRIARKMNEYEDDEYISVDLWQELADIIENADVPDDIQEAILAEMDLEDEFEED